MAAHPRAEVSESLSLVLDGRHIEALEVTGMHGNRIHNFERELHPDEIYGVDMSEGSLEKARARSNRVKWLRGPAEQLPFDDGTLDAVVTTSAFHFFDQPAALREFHRVLASGGLVAVAALSARNRCCRHPRPIGGNLSATHWRPRCGLCRKAQDSRLAITVPATGVDADRVRPDHRRHQKLKSLSDRFAASRFGSLLGGRGLTPRATVRRSRGNA